MKKIIFTLFAVLIFSTTLTAQSLIFQFQEDKSYCTIEIDTTLAVNMGTYRALNYLDAPYYEMTFTPEFEYSEVGETIIVATPTFHYYAYLAQIYGEVENADLNDKAFRMKFVMDPTGTTLTLQSTEQERKVVYNRSTFSRKKKIEFTETPTVFTKTNQVKLELYPKGIRRNVQRNIDKMKNRLDR